MSDSSIRISIIGAGKVGAQLTRAFHMGGVVINQIYNRSLEKAQILVDKYAGEAVTDYSDLTGSSDVFLVCVKDDAIPDVVSALNEVLPKDTLVAHTSGQQGMAFFENRFDNCGVFYPLQTFASESIVAMQEVPICILWIQ